MTGSVPWYSEVAETPINMSDGAWQIPELPGLGVEVNKAVAARHPFKQEALHTPSWMTAQSSTGSAAPPITPANSRFSLRPDG